MEGTSIKSIIHLLFGNGPILCHFFIANCSTYVHIQGYSAFSSVAQAAVILKNGALQAKAKMAPYKQKLINQIRYGLSLF